MPKDKRVLPKLTGKRKRATESKKVQSEALVSHNDSVWLFFGQNNTRRRMPGRPPHTDKMKHHGTWHVQLSGSKVWYLRATSELLEAAGVDHDDDTDATLPSHAVQCNAGDVLVVNTRLWWHSTKLPSLLQDPSEDKLCLSYARDFVISASATGLAKKARIAASTAQSDDEQEEEDDEDKEGDGGGGAGMGDVNVDGMLAWRRFKKGSLIMKASAMPKRKTPVCVTERPNCMVRGADLVAVKDIPSGELFLVLKFEEDEKDPGRMLMRTFVL